MTVKGFATTWFSQLRQWRQGLNFTLDRQGEAREFQLGLDGEATKITLVNGKGRILFKRGREVVVEKDRSREKAIKASVEGNGSLKAQWLPDNVVYHRIEGGHAVEKRG